MMNLYSVTIDIDWAPDFMIEHVANMLRNHNVKCTWFVTHRSPAIEALKNEPLFELGLHPNFFEGSSHGATEDEIIKFCFDIVPNATCVRTHALVQNSRLLKKLREEYGLLIDASLYIPNTPHLIPHNIYFSHANNSLTRIPYFWEDDLECYREDKSWDINNSKYHIEGMRIFNFHPMYIYLNSDTMHMYESLKIDKCSTIPMNNLMPEDITPYINYKTGTGTFFESLLNFIKSNNHGTFTLSEINEQFIR